MYKFLSVTALFLIGACNNSNTTKTAASDTAASSQTIHTNITDTVITTAKPMVVSGCYQMIMKQDTATLELSVKDTLLSGRLNFKQQEKDDNSGTLAGALHNDTIYADYTFQSEGQTSVREVAFKIQDGVLLQGFGDVIAKNNKAVFRDRNRLQFDTAHPFQKTACR